MARVSIGAAAFCDGVSGFFFVCRVILVGVDFAAEVLVTEEIVI